MIIIDNARDMRAWCRRQRRAGKSIGFVPTMGALHEGHLSLMRAAASGNDLAVASIFVNPTQFAPHEDFNKYPRTFDQDIALCASVGVVAVYAPTAKTMYTEDYSTFVTVGGVSEGLCGGSRPHFFRGVATVVTKLFNAVEADHAYFGQKDAQQCAVIRRMVRDLDMAVEIVEMPIVREADGLAMSSRNRYLSAEERSGALCLSRSLFAALDLMERGERDAETVKSAVRDGMREVKIDYVELVDAETMRPVERVERPVLLAVAALLESARLIDNVKFDPAGNGGSHT